MSIMTEYNVWCIDNCIGDGEVFIDNLKNVGKKDTRFLELYNILDSMRYKSAKIKQDLNDIHEFEEQLVVLYGYGFRILKEHLLLLLSFDNDLDKSDDVIELAFNKYKDNYTDFLDKLNSWDKKKVQDKIMDKVSKYKMDKAKKEACKKIYDLPTENVISEMSKDIIVLETQTHKDYNPKIIYGI